MKILIINRSNSKCGSCHRPADYGEKCHQAPMGWQQETGCGVEYTHVTTAYAGGGIEERVQQLRPDLEWIDWVDVVEQGAHR